MDNTNASFIKEKEKKRCITCDVKAIDNSINVNTVNESFYRSIFPLFNAYNICSLAHLFRIPGFRLGFLSLLKFVGISKGMINREFGKGFEVLDNLSTYCVFLFLRRKVFSLECSVNCMPVSWNMPTIGSG
jgi:hypothetical protein